MTRPATRKYVARIEYLSSGTREGVIVNATDRAEAIDKLQRRFKEAQTAFRLLSCRLISDADADRMWGAIEI